MELRLGAWFIVILCVQTLVISAPESLSREEQEQAVHGINGTIGAYGDGERGEFEEHHEIFHTGRAQGGGKGAHRGGGGNIDRRPENHQKNDASSLAKSASLILNHPMLHVSMALILVIPIFFSL
ncbi:uncharacterized protein LOC119992316 [Tripterygium wilfordii]|uniref:uncharacterized protein LOC119992316 n=1 Tax=Tripterygium wilfordii TaxID=458696 RepID=UPI0018F7EDE5|nr:uncharacterized protein LOC119992316 [Tripterygium wilfordii]